MTTVPDVETPGGREDSQWRKLQQRWDRWALDSWGLILGVVMYSLALTPSLLPRTWLMQGVACGLSAATGYGLGVLAHALWDRTGFSARTRLPETGRRIFDSTLLVLVILWIVGFNMFALRWQREVAELTDAQAYTRGEFLLVAPTAVSVWVGLILIARAISRLTDYVVDRTPERWDARFRTVVSSVGVAAVCLFVVDGVIPGTIVGISERVFSVRNTDIREDIQRPTLPERSGSPSSHNDWGGLGAYGTRFVGLGLHADELEAVTGRPAREPIRVYAGLDHGDTDAERAGRVVEELERTNAADREVLVLVATTGTGWVNPTFAQAVELLFDGDTAIAAVQYSYLPSAVQFISSREQVEAAGREFVTAVVDWWSKLPEAERPRIYVYGESLGTTSGEAAFSGARDLAASVDGALWVGPVNSNDVWTTAVEHREPGSRQVEPVYNDGETVRFVQNSESISEMDTTGWGDTRVLYVQHPTDPVVWWSPNLLFSAPDWLRESPGFDRSPSMFWMPFVTFFQMTLDLPNAANVPDGHGHNYGDAVLDGFAAVTGDLRFDARFIDSARAHLEVAMASQGPEKEIGVRQPLYNREP